MSNKPPNLEQSGSDSETNDDHKQEKFVVFEKGYAGKPSKLRVRKDVFPGTARKELYRFLNGHGILARPVQCPLKRGDEEAQ